MSNKYIGRLVTRFMKRTNGAPLLIVFPEYDNGDNDEDKNTPPFRLVTLTSDINNIKEIYSDDDSTCFLNRISTQKLNTTHSGVIRMPRNGKNMVNIRRQNYLNALNQSRVGATVINVSR